MSHHESAADLSLEERRALLVTLLRKRARRSPGASLSFPLSFAQERLWIIDQFEPGTPLYNTPVALRITGPLDAEVARRVLNEIVRRHEVLRTTFATANGRPVQIVAPTLALTLPVVDLRALTGTSREAEARQLTDEEARRPFELARGPLLRVTLLRLGDEEHILVATMHHVVSDGWSMTVLLREMIALYEAFAIGAPSPLADPRIQYADFAVWQRQWLQGEVLETQLAYWRQQLAGLPVLELTTDRPRPAVQTHRGASERFVLPQPLTDALKTLSRREGVTLFMTLLAAFQTLLHRYSGQDDIVVGSPIAGRNRAELEGLIGFFVNTLVLRTTLTGNPSFRTLLQRVREVCLGAYARQDLPFERLVEELQPARDLGRTPLFQVMFVLEPRLPPLIASGFTFSPLQVDAGTTIFDLTLLVMETDQELAGSLIYNTDLFDTATIVRMRDHLRILLEAIVTDSQQPLLALPCLSEPERRQLLTKQSTLKRRNAPDRLGDLEELTNLTTTQLLVWLGQKLQPDVPLYNLAATLTIRGEVDPEHFQRAFQTLVNSSDAFRTVVDEADGVPHQRVLSTVPAAMEYLDFSDASEPEARLATWVRRRCHVPLTLNTRLFDPVLIKLSPNAFVWYLNQHHIVTDGWSVWLVFSHMADFYVRSLRGSLEEQVALPRFHDYVKAQQAYRRSPRYLDAHAYWTRKLAAEMEPIAFYGKTPLKRTTRVQRVSCNLGVERTQKLHALAVQAGRSGATAHASLFHIFATLLCTFLYRTGGTRHITLGTIVHNRRSKAFKQTIGLFMQMLPLRVLIEDGDTFFSLIKKVKGELFDSLRHAECTIRNPLQSKVYDVVLNYHTVSNALHGNFNGAPVQTEVVHTGHENDSLGLRVLDFGASGSFTLDFDFHCDVFPESQRGQAIQHFLRLVDALLEDPTQSLDRVPLLSAVERERVVVTFNRPVAALPDGTVAHLFEAQAQRTPDRPAVLGERRALTYAQLNAQANQLAHRLRALGVHPEVLVGLCVERSLAMLVGLLGILKAGGAYVPLDPAYPTERLAFLLADTQTPVLVTQARLVERLPPHRAQLVCLDTDWPTIAQESAANPASGGATAENLAYVIYTSGSTGSPKGVLVRHRAVVNHNLAVAKRFALCADDRVLQFHSITFDAAVEELFPSWLSGAAVVVRGDDVLAPDPDLLRLIEREQLTVLNLPTPYWHEVVSAWTRSVTTPPPSLRLVIVGGDAASTERLAAWRKLAGPRVQWINTYGPTEATIIATVYDPAECPVEQDGSAVSIGRPLPNTTIYLLDRYLEPVPLGVPGEVYIGGVGLARGYLRRPDLTADRFLPDPFGSTPGARLYRTGDLARHRPDGTLEFLGRLDHQIKLRGYRVELGEVEAALRQHPAVRDTVVLARKDVPGDARLVAYVVAEPTASPSAGQLRGFLKTKLPEYMVPAAFVLLDAFPLAPSGKVNRRALPTPDVPRAATEHAFVAPGSPVEEILAAIWAEILRVERVGVHDNFFELGGDSILGIQVIARANAAGLRLTPKQLFLHQTVAELAGVVGATQTVPAEQGLVTGAAPLTPIQHRFFEQDPADPHYFNQAILLETRQALEPALLERAVQHLLRHHDALRLRFVREARGWHQVTGGLEETTPLTRVDLSLVPAADQVAAIEATASELQASLNLSDGPLIRVALFDLGGGRSGRLFMVIHHLAVDGVSWRILLEDLYLAYQQLSRGEPIQLLPKTTSYKDWAERLAEHDRAAIPEHELAYWLAEARTHVRPLPVDYTAGANTVASAGTVSVSLSVEETRALLQQGPAAYGTQINDMLLTALVEAFVHWTGERALLVHLEGHGREEIFDDVDLSRTVGWFTTLFPLLLNPPEASHLGDALKSIKEQLRSVPNRGIGYGLLRYVRGDAKLAERLAALPQPQVSFNYLGQLDQTLPESSPFGLASESSGSAHSLRGDRPHLLDINGGVVGGQLRFFWTYSENVHQRATIERVAQRFSAALQSLITHCLSAPARSYTPSDFPLAKLDQHTLDWLAGGNGELEDVYPLAPMQQTIFSHARRMSGSAAYFGQFSCALDGVLDITAFRRAWRRVVDRHAALRTSFVWEGLNQPLQIVRRPVRLDWTELDWRAFSPSEQEARLEAYLQADRHRGFDLLRAPLMRLALIRLARETYQFVCSLPHLLLDGWSLPVLLKEVFAFYEAFRQGHDWDLEASRPYRNYIAWLRRQDVSKAQAFWREALKGFTAPTRLFPDRVSESLLTRPGDDGDYREREFRIPTTATASLQSFARQHQLTLSTLVHGAWALLLSHYAGARDVVFGTVVANRPVALAEVESILGLFINALPVRVHMSPDAPILRWLRELQAQHVELRQYDYVSLEEIHSWSDVPRSLPLFESIVRFQNYPAGIAMREWAQTLSIRHIRSLDRWHYPLGVLAVPGPELSIQLGYDQRRFDSTSIRSLAEHFQALLEGIQDRAEHTLADLISLGEPPFRRSH